MFVRLKSINLYTGVSLLKLLVGALIVVLTLLTLNVKEDPEIALSFLLVGVFIFAWGVAYFLFYGGELLFLLKVPQEKMQKDAYKASFLFGLYALINVLLLVGKFRNKWLGLLFLIAFIALQAILFINDKQKK